MQCRYNEVNDLKKYSPKTPHSSPVKASYGVSFVDPASDWYSTWVPGIIYAISYYIGPCYNGIQLYYFVAICYKRPSFIICNVEMNEITRNLWKIFNSDQNYIGIVQVRNYTSIKTGQINRIFICTYNISEKTLLPFWSLTEQNWMMKVNWAIKEHHMYSLEVQQRI